MTEVPSRCHGRATGEESIGHCRDVHWNPPTFHTCPIPEVARLGRALRRWREQFLGYFTTDRSSNGGTEAINGIIELHTRLARGYRNRHNYRRRMLLVAGGLLLPPELR